MIEIFRLFHTVKYLKFRQIYFRIFYFVRARFRKIFGIKYEFLKESKSSPLNLMDSIESNSNYENSKFSFLNIPKRFDEAIDWNFSKHGKLWTYNLTYFEYLKSREDVGLIHEFIENISSARDGLEPFPISLRGINWIKFLTNYEIKDQKIDNSLYAQYYILLDNLEYHLLGNHLLENGFSLLFGAYYFQDEYLYKKAHNILKDELREQILEDGGHFELSPMYHQIMLFRLLDSINLVQNNSYKNQELLLFLTTEAESMLGWLQNITYKDGEIPLLNDSANRVAPTSNELFDYAERLNIKTKKLTLNESGYRKVIKDKYECIVDTGDVGAKYIPGHAHADTLNFELRIGNKPFIVDSGLSTYETNEIRFYERSTKAHNTVEVSAKDSSEVWGGFRVANRANVVELLEKDDFIKATHDGYMKNFGALHTRSWKFEEDKIVIEDSLNKECNAVARLHFHPDVTKEEISRRVKNLRFTISSYNYAQEFNKTIEALVLEIKFNKKLKVELEI